MKNNCVFCAIAANEIPSFKVYEDDLVLAYLDINPFSKGHTLVIPKEHSSGLLDTPDETLAALVARVKKVESHLKAALPCDGFCRTTVKPQVRPSCTSISTSFRDTARKIFHSSAKKATWTNSKRLPTESGWKAEISAFRPETVSAAEPPLQLEAIRSKYSKLPQPRRI